MELSNKNPGICLQDAALIGKQRSRLIFCCGNGPPRLELAERFYLLYDKTSQGGKSDMAEFGSSRNIMRSTYRPIFRIRCVHEGLISLNRKPNDFLHDPPPRCIFCCRSCFHLCDANRSRAAHQPQRRGIPLPQKSEQASKREHWTSWREFKHL